LGMALDESQDDDAVFTDRDVKYLVNKTLFEKVKPVAIDYITTPRGEGFKLSSSMDAAASCGSSCSC
jgi:Fe-S cluster assembly iron-binding protein IscA